MHIKVSRTDRLLWVHLLTSPHQGVQLGFSLKKGKFSTQVITSFGESEEFTTPEHFITAKEMVGVLVEHGITQKNFLQEFLEILKREGLCE